MSRRFRDLLLRRLDAAALADEDLARIKRINAWFAEQNVFEDGDGYYATQLALSHADAFVKSRSKVEKSRRGKGS